MIATLAVGVLGWLGAAPRSAAAAAAVRAPQLLSNELTFTRWAYVDQIAAIHRLPTMASGLVGHLHWYTEDGFPEVYLVLQAARDAAGGEWVQLRVPGRPNGRTGWVPRTALGPLHLTHSLLVLDRRSLRLSFWWNGRPRWSAPAGIGAPDSPTPAGHFWIRELFAIADPASGYWPYAFGTADYSILTDWPGGGVVGIHGPYGEPQLIPGRISHGCIRLSVRDDVWLAYHVGVGTPLDVI